MPSPYPGRAWSGVITVGTPHWGAPLAASARDGEIGAWILGVVGDAGDAVNYYTNLFFDNSISTAIDRYGDLIGLSADLLNWVATLELSSAEPVTADMVPGSNFLTNGVNSTSNITREASAIPVRVGITSAVTNNNGIVWKGLRGADWQGPYNTQNAISAAFFAAYAAAAMYENPDDPNQVDINANAYRFWDAGADLDIMDENWCILMGAWNGTGCMPSDGIVPVWAQGYPGASSVAITGPSHTEETTSAQLHTVLVSTLGGTFAIPPVPPPPPIWHASIYGTSVMRPGDTCHWIAQTDIADASFEWSVGGAVVGSGQDLYYAASTDFTLDLNASNTSTGASASGSLAITVSEDNDGCVEQRPVRVDATRRKLPASPPTEPGGSPHD